MDLLQDRVGTSVQEIKPLVNIISANANGVGHLLWAGAGRLAIGSACRSRYERSIIAPTPAPASRSGAGLAAAMAAATGPAPAPGITIVGSFRRRGKGQRRTHHGISYQSKVSDVSGVNQEKERDVSGVNQR